MKQRDSTEPIATVVVPTRDRPRMLKRAVASALCQSQTDIEVVIVDDGSEHPVVTDWPDPRVRVIRREDRGGPCIARNDGMAASRGRWITFLDDDDELLPHMIEASLHAATQSRFAPPVAVWSQKETRTSSNDVITVARPMTLAINSFAFLSDYDALHASNTLLVETDLLKSIGGWDPSVEYAEQLELFLRLNRTCPIDVVPDVTYIAYRHEGTRQSQRIVERGDSFMRISRKHQDVLRQHADVHSMMMANAVHSYLRADSWQPAITAAARGVAINRKDPEAYGRLALSVAGPRLSRTYRSIRLYTATARRKPAR